MSDKWQSANVTIDPTKSGKTGLKPAEKIGLLVSQANDGNYNPASIPTADSGNTSDSTLALTGLPKESFKMAFKVITAGQIGTSTFQLSYNNGASYGNEIATTGSSPFEYTDDYGQIITVTDAATNYLISGDFWTWESFKGTIPNTIYTLKKNTYEDILVGGRAFEYCKTFFDTELGGVYPAQLQFCRPANDVSSSIGSVSADAGNIGNGVCAASGTPTLDADVVIKIAEVAGLSETVFMKWSFDGGATFSNTIITPTSGSDTYIGSGVLVSLTDGGTDWVVGDKYTFSITAKSCANVLKALTDSLTIASVSLLDYIKTDLDNFTGFYIDQENAKSDLDVLSEILDDVDTEGFGTYSMSRCTDKLSGETYSAWYTARKNEINAKEDFRQYFTAHATKYDNGLDVYPLPILTAYFALLRVHQSPAKVKIGKLKKVVGLVDETSIKPFLKKLSEQKFTVVRTYASREGYYFNTCHSLGNDSDTIRDIVDMRVMAKAQRVIQYHTTSVLGGSLTAVTGMPETLCKNIQNLTLTSMEGELTSLEITPTFTESVALENLKPPTSKLDFDVKIKGNLILRRANGKIQYV